MIRLATDTVKNRGSVDFTVIILRFDHDDATRASSGRRQPPFTESTSAGQQSAEPKLRLFGSGKTRNGRWRLLPCLAWWLSRSSRFGSAALERLGLPRRPRAPGPGAALARDDKGNLKSSPAVSCDSLSGKSLKYQYAGHSEIECVFVSFVFAVHYRYSLKLLRTGLVQRPTSVLNSSVYIHAVM
jgi:hypothetical protein